MTALETLAGTATAGTLYGIGVGPGDVRYLALRAAGLIGAVDVIAYFAKKAASLRPCSPRAATNAGSSIP